MARMSIAQIRQIYLAAEEAALPSFTETFGCDERAGVKALVRMAEKRLDNLEKERERIEKLKKYEREYARYEHICGIDEAGRGPLAGPVVAAAVILPKDCGILYINDSKKLSEKKREELYGIIMEQAVSVGVGIVNQRKIDEINILQATYEAMRIAVKELKVTPDLLLNDAVTIPEVKIPQVPIIKGDAKSISIGAASIIAKVVRDRLMTAYDTIMPGYGFATNKGYGSQAHIEAIKKFGPTELHRKTFIKNFYDEKKHSGGRMYTFPQCYKKEEASVNTRKVGAEYEKRAARFLEQKGWKILEQNFRCRSGEIDLVALDGPCLVFVEVKYRRGDGHGDPVQAVDHRKRQRVSNAALYYMYTHGYRTDMSCRFDVVGILGDEIRLITNAFPYCGYNRQ